MGFYITHDTHTFHFFSLFLSLCIYGSLAPFVYRKAIVGAGTPRMAGNVHMATLEAQKSSVCLQASSAEVRICVPLLWVLTATTGMTSLLLG